MKVIVILSLLVSCGPPVQYKDSILNYKGCVVISKPIDPIIFQYCPFGVLIYTMWGAEDKVFEEYKKLNNLV